MPKYLTMILTFNKFEMVPTDFTQGTKPHKEIKDENPEQFDFVNYL